MELIIHNNRSPEKQAEVDEILCKAIHAQDLGLIKELLQDGASANARIHYESMFGLRHEPTAYRTSPLHYSIQMNPNIQLCKLLLDYGADIEDKNDSPSPLLKIGWLEEYLQFDMYKLVFDYGAHLSAITTSGEKALASEAQCATVSNNVLKCLIICPIFNPKLDFFCYKKIIATLSALKHYGLPKDIRLLILRKYLNLTSSLKEIPSFKQLAAIKEETAHTIPMRFVRILIERGQLNPKKTVAALKNNHIQCVKPFMEEALPQIEEVDASLCDIKERKKILDPALVEENFGDAIERTIRARLGLLTWHEKAYDALPHTLCNIQ